MCLLQNLQRKNDYFNALQSEIKDYSYLDPNVFSITFTFWIIFYYYYSDPKVPDEFQEINIIFTQ